MATENFRVREMRRQDLTAVLSWRNHESVRNFMFTRNRISEIEHADWFARASTDSTRRLLIAEDEGLPAGFVQFNNVVERGVASWGFYVRPLSPKGTGRKLGVSALNYAFRDLGLSKVCGQALELNAASIALHEKLGFTREGIFRDHQIIDGVFHSIYCFGLLQREWK